VERGQLRVRQDGLTAAKADLVEAQAGFDQHREGARADLGEERARVARRDAVELGPVIGDDARQAIDAARGALGIGHGGDVVGQIQPFHQRHHVDAALFQHCAIVERHAVHLEFGQAFGQRPARPVRNEARTR
jgi:hypothetical protein